METVNFFVSLSVTQHQRLNDLLGFNQIRYRRSVLKVVEEACVS